MESVDGELRCIRLRWCDGIDMVWQRKANKCLKQLRRSELLLKSRAERLDEERNKLSKLKAERENSVLVDFYLEDQDLLEKEPVGKRTLFDFISDPKFLFYFCLEFDFASFDV